MDRTWVREMGDLGAALPAVVQLDRFPPEKLVAMSLCTMADERGERCFLVVIGERLTPAEVRIIGSMVNRVGSPTERTVAELMADPDPTFRATGSATSIVVAVNEWLRSRMTS